MFLDRRSLPRRIAASACVGAAAFQTIGGSLFIAKGSIGAALLVAAPLAAAQAASPSSRAQARLADEPAWGPFVYEQLGATPSVRITWSASAATARVESMGARVQARPAVADRTSVATGSQTVAADTPEAERRSRD
ncbi:MAG: hypothetical protein ACK5XM_00560 [Betaproteobacteria bacterium]